MPEDTDSATIYVVEHDKAVRDGLRALLSQLNAQIQVYDQAKDLLSLQRTSGPACLVTELFLPDMSGLELLKRLRKSGDDIPAIVLAIQSDVPTAVEAMRLGAIDFIEKPFVEHVLLERVREALRSQEVIHA
ncbi:MAG: response regulator [Gammaproteobacteria bacterium]|nr:response regulator [Gammaproteobacteria bacterium]